MGSLMGRIKAFGKSAKRQASESNGAAPSGETTTATPAGATTGVGALAHSFCTVMVC